MTSCSICFYFYTNNTIPVQQALSELLRTDMSSVASSLCISKATCLKCVLMSAAQMYAQSIKLLFSSLNIVNSTVLFFSFHLLKMKKLRKVPLCQTKYKMSSQSTNQLVTLCGDSFSGSKNWNSFSSSIHCLLCQMIGVQITGVEWVNLVSKICEAVLLPEHAHFIKRERHQT